jgi:hypothetical protein
VAADVLKSPNLVFLGPDWPARLISVHRTLARVRRWVAPPSNPPHGVPKRPRPVQSRPGSFRLCRLLPSAALRLEAGEWNCPETPERVIVVAVRPRDDVMQPAPVVTVGGVRGRARTAQRRDRPSRRSFRVSPRHCRPRMRGVDEADPEVLISRPIRPSSVGSWRLEA